ncbi:Rrf2 family transcriptional regulator [Cytophagaceae bacterium DM2B3-1]|uniref:Rrf2 family transcriptional regulator n=1 Tax=Xanthocytophaga flava TaxID=3048013 RepID=A0AAE3U655_9BACT|nr:Rrf2 family transcriptional regulator [Xanthocytophaga flavus]MDJ1470680.1 Rrf2 family transcriptional regulator [Xanthocytophaga flavus]MDJ1481499.1 Rrf2 family transcriptional regulator [Xanthocytophaga flavus]MDJ1491477.1 Rrf2 family transcriptional regulator [Xanthocytophaga flavus]
MLSKKAKYALKALFVLARDFGNDATLIAEIAEQERIPKKFLEAILLDLKNHGILFSRRGKTGGYGLLKSPDQITMGQVVRIIDGPLAWVPCARQNGYQPCDECNDVETCSIRITMRKVRDATAEILDSTTLADCVRLEKEPLDWII